MGCLCSTMINQKSIKKRYIDEYLPKNLENYKFLHELESGKYCDTYLFKRVKKVKTIDKIVIKKYKNIKNKNDIYLKIELTIIKILMILPSNNLVLSRVVEPEKKDLKSNVIIMEYCEKGDLYELLKRDGILEENKVGKFIIGIARGLKHLNLLGYIHRDIKLENILVDGNDNIKICDFNLSARNTRMKKRDDFVGTKCYRAPEVVNTSFYGKACDIWSLGTVVHILLTGKYPYCEKDNEPKWDSSIKKSNIYIRLTFRMRHLIEDMLLYNQINRIDANEILELEWLRGETL